MAESVRKEKIKRHIVLWTRADLVLLALIGIFAVLLLLLSAVKGKASLAEPRLEISVGNRLYGTYPLSEDRTIPIYETNTCEIRDGEVRMTWADCPYQICVHSGPLTETGGSIICLPNHVVLKITGGDETEREVDTIAE